MKVFPGHGQAEERHHRRILPRTCAIRRTCSKVQRAAGQVPRRRPGDVLLDVRLLGRAAGSRTRPSQLPAAVLHRRQRHCAQRLFVVVPADQCDEPVPARLPGGLHQRQFRPGHLRQDHRADHPRSGQRPKLAFNAISTDTAVSQDLGVIGRDNQNRIRWGNLLTLPVGAGLLYVAGVRLAGQLSDAALVVPAADPGGDDVRRQGRLRPTVRMRSTASSAPARAYRDDGPAPAPGRACRRLRRFRRLRPPCRRFRRQWPPSRPAV